MAGKTLYVFDNDLESSMSQCNDTCATNWPPVIADPEGIKNIPGLSLIERADGAMQVAYLGRPLYTYIKDEESGAMNGDGANNIWWAVKLPTSGLQVEGSNVTTTDIYTSNGVVHLIDTVITEVK
jgi:predicted lipoprotein with Yx(FWY)xxD motif